MDLTDGEHDALTQMMLHESVMEFRYDHLHIARATVRGIDDVLVVFGEEDDSFTPLAVIFDADVMSEVVDPPDDAPVPMWVVLGDDEEDDPGG